jgi:cobalamin biosynthesis Mg chelatase CobN
MKSDVQVLENEVKSMTEIINILRDELKYNCPYKDHRNSNNTYEEKLKTSSTQCCKCTQLESQLQVVLNELSSVKIITDILSEEFKSLKQTSHVDTSADNLWANVKPNNSRGPTATRPPKTAHASLGTSNSHQYTVPITNR